MSLIFSCDVIAACCIYFLPKFFLETDKKTGNPIIPDAFLPPETIRHVFAHVANIVPVPRLDSAAMPTEDSDGNDCDDIEPRAHEVSESALTKSQRRTGRQTAMPRVAEEPRDIFKDSFRGCEGSYGGGLEFDTLMTATGRTRPTNILNDIFDFDTLHRSNGTVPSVDARTQRQRAGTEKTVSAGTSSGGISDCLGDEAASAQPRGTAQQLGSTEQQAGMISAIMSPLQEEEVEDESAVSC